MRRQFITSLVVLGLVAWSSSLQGQCAVGETAVAADRDNTLYEDAGGALSNGAGNHFFVGRAAGGSSDLARRGLIRFDVAGVLPAGSVVASATLMLNMSRTISFDEIVSLHPVLADWGESSSVAPGQEGGGAPSEMGDATWIHTFFDSSTWMTAGGDYLPAASATTEIEDIGPYSWGSTPEMVADVQGWIDAPAANFGWILVGNENSGTTAKRFDSRENSDPAVRPVLCLGSMPAPTVEIPALGDLGLLFLALLLGLVAWQRVLRFDRPSV